MAGLYDLFKDHIEGELTVTAMANGISSRPAVFKKNLEQAQVMNLIIALDGGKVDELDWRNNCFDNQGCSPDDCKDTSVTYKDEVNTEHNCLKNDCAAANPNPCDTQVFLTWVGRDNDRDDCTSDNYRISGFTNFSIISYLNSAKDLVNYWTN